MVNFVMPKLGADMASGRLVRWCRNPGERIARGEILAVIETDKTNVDVESFYSGVLERILVEPGDARIPVGTPLAVLRTEAEPGAAAVAEGMPAPIAAAQPAAPAVVPASASAGAPAAAMATTRAAPPAAAPSAASAQKWQADGRLRASPAARQRAAELQIDVTGIGGTGPGGRITLQDVENAAAARSAAAAPAAAQSGAQSGTVTRQQRMREAIASAMARSKREIPHYYLATEIDLTAVNAWLDQANRDRPVTARLLYGVLLIKAVAVALRGAPELNGFWIDGRAVPGDGIHPGVAISLRGGGLVAPALRHADQRSIEDLMAAFRDLVQRARANSLKSSEITDPTITITSLGERGVDAVFGIITPPQLALVGFGKPVERPRVMDAQVLARSAITATLAGDHRATDGHRGALFLDAIAQLLQQPEKL